MTALLATQLPRYATAAYAKSFLQEKNGGNEDEKALQKHNILGGHIGKSPINRGFAGLCIIRAIQLPACPYPMDFLQEETVTKIETHCYLNRESQPRQLATQPAHTTILEYLRKEGLVGTKEGCATGDCGACSAVLVKLVGNKLVFEGVNTCIAPLPTVAGKLLITVEGLLGKDGSLHPVQRAMVDLHGSQCGFCSPGFVMSLFIHVKNGAKGGRDEMIERLSGNLCRCTGYLPIIRAGLALDKSHAQDWYSHNERLIKKRLRGLNGNGKGNGSSVLPKSVAQIAKGLEGKGNGKSKKRLVAGATDLGIELTQDLVEPELVFAEKANGFSSIKQTKTHWEIGAGTTWAEIDGKLSAELSGLREIMFRFGSPNLRARATVGGNIVNASPIADGPPIFLALGCELTLRKGEKRRKVKLCDFYTGYKKTVLRQGEFVEKLRLERPTRGAHFNTYKVSKRYEDDLSTVCAAYLVRLDRAGKVTGARIAYGGMAPTSSRAYKCEKALVGEKWDEETIDRACKELGKDFVLGRERTSPRYRTMLAGNLLRRYFHWTTKQRETIAKPNGANGKP